MVSGCGCFIFSTDEDLESGVEGWEVDLPGWLEVLLVLLKFLSYW